MSTKALERAIQIVSNGNQTKFAAALSELSITPVSQQLVNYWLANKGCSAAYCELVERLTGGTIKRWDLRPDLFPQQQDKAA